MRSELSANRRFGTYAHLWRNKYEAFRNLIIFRKLIKMRKLQFWYIENGTFFSIAIAKHFRDNPMHNKNLTYGETIQQNNWVKTHCIAEIVDSNISYQNAENKMSRRAHND